MGDRCDSFFHSLALVVRPDLRPGMGEAGPRPQEKKLRGYAHPDATSTGSGFNSLSRKASKDDEQRRARMSSLRRRVSALVTTNPRLTAQTTLFNLARLAIGAVGSILLARWLGPHGRGLLAAALLLPPLLVAIGGSGVAPAFFYLSGSQRVERSRLTSSAAYLAVVQSMVLCLGGYVLVGLLFSTRGAELTFSASIYLATIPAGFLGVYYLQILLGAGEVRLYNWIGMVIPVGYLIGIIALAVVDRLDILPLVVLQICLNGSVSVLSMFALRRRRVKILAYGPRAIAKTSAEVLRYAVRALAGDASSALNLRLDQLIVAALLPPSQLAFYAVAVSITGVLSVFPTAVKIVNTPQIAQQADSDERENLIRLTTRTLLRVALPLWIVATIMLPILTRLVLGPEWAPVLKPELVLIAAGVVLGFKEVLVACAAASGDPWLGSRTELVGLTVTIAGLVLLVPSFGIMGAALTSLAAYLISTVTVARGFQRRLGYRVFAAPRHGRKE